MIEILVAAVVAFGVVFTAELGDKTQLLALNFGTRYPFSIVALGLAIGYGLANLLATVVGGVLGAALPERPIELVGGSIFLVFAVLALRSDGGDDDAVSSPTGRSMVASVAVAIAVAEMGDKTQIATAALAAQSHPVAIWIGSTLGAATSGLVGAVAGNLAGDRISQRALQLSSAALFTAFGVVMIAGWL